MKTWKSSICTTKSYCGRKNLVTLCSVAVINYNIPFPHEGLLGCGDDKGNLWLYNVGYLLKKSSQADELLRPSRVSIPVFSTLTFIGIDGVGKFIRVVAVWEWVGGGEGRGFVR